MPEIKIFHTLGDNELWDLIKENYWQLNTHVGENND